MPSSPEFRCCLREKGLAEILRQTDAKQSGRADDHIHHPGELHVKLDRVADGCHNDQHAILLLIFTKQGRNDDVQPVGHDQLLEHPPADAHSGGCHLLQRARHAVRRLNARHTASRYFRLLRKAGKLHRSISVACNRSFHRLRKEPQEKRNPDEIPVRRNSSPVDLEKISHRFKRIEGYTDRHKQPWRDDRSPACMHNQLVQLPHKKAGIFQIEKDTKQNTICKEHHSLMRHGLFSVRFPGSGRRTLRKSISELPDPDSHEVSPYRRSEKIDNQIPAAQKEIQPGGTGKHIPSGSFRTDGEQ